MCVFIKNKFGIFSLQGRRLRERNEASLVAVLGPESRQVQVMLTEFRVEVQRRFVVKVWDGLQLSWNLQVFKISLTPHE